MTNIYIRQIIYNRTNVWVMQQLVPITAAHVHTNTHTHMHTHIFKVYMYIYSNSKKVAPQKSEIQTTKFKIHHQSTSLLT